jgi:hypothetical protein
LPRIRRRIRSGGERSVTRGGTADTTAEIRTTTTRDGGAGVGHTRGRGAHAAETHQKRTAITNGGGATIPQNDTRGGTEMIPIITREDTATGTLTVDAMARDREMTTLDAMTRDREIMTLDAMTRDREIMTLDALGSPQETTTVNGMERRPETTTVNGTERRPETTTVVAAGGPRRATTIDAMGGRLDVPARRTRRMLRQSGRASWRLCSLPPPSWTSIDRSASRRWRSGSVRHARLTTRAARGAATERSSIACTSRRVPSTWETGWGEAGKDIRETTTTEHAYSTCEYIISVPQA